MKIGLFFGSFNPVHIGHMIIANFMSEHTDLDEVWMVVSPHNPHKKKASLANNYDRLHLVNLAIGESTTIRSSNIEFSLPIPSYTIDTLSYLKEKYNDKDFVLIMGGDNIATLHKWKNYEQILAHHNIYVYARPGYELGELQFHEKVEIIEAPLLSISASFIRKLIAEDRSIRYLVPDAVYRYLEENPLYKNK